MVIWTARQTRQIYAFNTQTSLSLFTVTTAIGNLKKCKGCLAGNQEKKLSESRIMISFLKFPNSAPISIHLTQEVDACRSGSKSFQNNYSCDILTKSPNDMILTWSGWPFHCLRCLMGDGQLHPSQYPCSLDHLQQQTHHPAQAKTKTCEMLK